MRHSQSTLLAAGFLCFILARPTLAQSGGGQSDPVASAQTFKRIAEVLRHPRCMNCHTVTDFPRQGDDRHRHHQMVVRGPSGRGTSAMLCSNCHQEKNSPDGLIPGAHNWHLAPLSMAWEQHKTDKALCESLKDRSLNGDKNVAALVHHMHTDALVLWAWEPGTRKPPHIGKEEFQALLKRWEKAGGACPTN